MKEHIFVMLLGGSLAAGYTMGWANYHWSKWIMAPAFVFIVGATVRMFWGKP